VITDPHGKVLWLSPALPGRCHDLTAARAHRIIRICERQGVPILADRAYIGAGAWVTTPARGPPGGEPTLTQQTVNRALSKARAPRRGRSCPSEVLADLPQSAVQPESNDVNRRSRPHPGAATLKDLTVRPGRGFARRAGVAAGRSRSHRVTGAVAAGWCPVVSQLTRHRPGPWCRAGGAARQGQRPARRPGGRYQRLSAQTQLVQGSLYFRRSPFFDLARGQSVLSLERGGGDPSACAVRPCASTSCQS